MSGTDGQSHADAHVGDGAGCAHDHGGGASGHGSSLGRHEAQEDVVCIDGLGFSYPDGTRALTDVTLHVPRGSMLGIIGPNGGGKTTLLKIMLGLLTGYAGHVAVAGLPPHQVSRRGDVVGYVPQHRQWDARFPVSVRQAVRMGLVGRTGLLRWYRANDLKHVDDLLEQLGIAEIAERPIGDLSGGQQQRALIARALAPQPRMLVLDEPTVGIDVSGQQRFAELLRHLHDELGLTIIVVSHDLRAVAGSCDRVACLSRTIHYHDDPAGLTPELLHEVFEHDIAPLRREGGVVGS